MLHKSLVSVLTLLYSLSTIGMPLHFHYCRGELKHVSVLVKMECHVPDQPTSGHACCKSLKPHCEAKTALNNCCDDSTQWIQDDIPALCVKNSDLEEVATSDLVRIVVQPLSGPYKTSHSTSPVENVFASPPPLYLLQCSLIFYG